jgi:hypothetical protein
MESDEIVRKQIFEIVENQIKNKHNEKESI